MKTGIRFSNRLERIVFMLPIAQRHFMTHRKWIGLWTLMLAFVFAQAARAGGHPPQQNTTQPLVVLVGIDKYNDSQIKPRQHAEADAAAIYDLFVSKEHLGVSPKNVKLLLGSSDGKRPSEPATRANILSALTWIE